MQITFLGTGTSQGIPIIGCKCEVCTSSDSRDNRLRCSLLISHNDKNYVIDVGPDFRMQMLRAEVEDIECVFLTHEHNDHIIGLDDLRPFIFRHKKAIELYGLPRVLEEIEDRFKYAFINHPYPGAPSFKLKPLLPKEKWTDGNIEVEALQVYHGSLEILGYRIGDVAYLTDVKSLTEETFATLQGIPHLIISALRKERPHHSHLILDEALEIIQQINPDKAYLIHLSHLMGTHKSTEALLDKNVQIAYDGLVVET